MSIKIQINSLEALERLIGGDNELELQIRTSIVHEFTNKHLKSLATSKLMKDTENAIMNEIENQFFDLLKVEYGILKSVSKIRLEKISRLIYKLKEIEF